MRFILAWELACKVDFFSFTHSLVWVGGKSGVEGGGGMDGVGQGRK